MSTRKEKLLADAVAAVLPLVQTAHDAAISTATALAAADATTKDTATKNAAASDATNKANNVKSQTDAAIAAATATAASAMTAAQATPSRIRTKRVSVPALAVGASQVVTVTWDTAFPSTNYTVPRPGVTGAVVLDVQVSNKTTAGCTVTLKNAGLLALLAGVATVEILAIHDPLAA